MKLELKENMYVRNCYGRIAKIEDIEDNIAYCDNWLYQRYEEFITFIDLNNEKDINKITKVSYNIIDILEVGDYVNGKKIVDVGCLTNGPRKGTKVIDYYITPSAVCYLENEDIKSIVTKEQFENMEYRIGE